MKPKIIGVVGPTASGKTAFSIDMALKRNGEIVSCDSMQIYKYMNIGTAKATKEEQLKVKHHMIDFVDPNTDYSVADFVKDARCAIDDILRRGKTPVLCGGTGLYFDSIINNIEFSEQKCDEDYRAELQKMAEKDGNEAVYKLLEEIDPVTAQKVHPNNLKRVIRALEICKTCGMTKTEADKLALREPVYDAEIYGMDMERERLYDRINRRVDKMIEDGLLEEVDTLIKMGIRRNSTAMQAIGYKEIVEYFDGDSTLSDAIEKIKQESRRYAKRQITWFKRNTMIMWQRV